MAKSRRKEGGAVLTPDAPHAPQMSGDSTVARPDRERIAARAYELYRARGGGEGLALDDWLAAEREFQQTHNDEPGQS